MWNQLIRESSAATHSVEDAGRWLNCTEFIAVEFATCR